jgi:hypothetical protein
MDVVTLAAIGLGVVAVAAAAVAFWQWSAHKRTRAALAEALAEAEVLRSHDAQLHEAFEIYRERHKHLTDRVRPRRLTDDQRHALRMHLREIPGLRVRIRVAADTEPAVAAADLGSALIAAGAAVEIEETDVRLGDNHVGGLLEVSEGGRGRLFRAAIRAYSFPMTDAPLAVVRVRRGGAEDDAPEAVITIGSARVPPELTDLPPPPKPPPAKKASTAPATIRLPTSGGAAID